MAEDAKEPEEKKKEGLRDVLFVLRQFAALAVHRAGLHQSIHGWEFEPLMAHLDKKLHEVVASYESRIAALEKAVAEMTDRKTKS